MKDLIKWALDNEELILNIIRFLLTAGSFVYASIIHYKSKKRLSTLEAKEEIQKDLLKTIEDLKIALERSKKDG